jgi:hypothetical protein
MLDYWGLSLTQASRGLIALLAQRHEVPPGGPWKVAVCGPESPVRVALGPAFKLAAPAQADFALSLGEFYCAKLDAPVLLQIVRDGIVYARVYDIRGRSIAKLTLVVRFSHSHPISAPSYANVRIKEPLATISASGAFGFDIRYRRSRLGG